jgi:hypothetical protein
MGVSLIGLIAVALVGLVVVAVVAAIIVAGSSRGREEDRNL